MARCDGRLDESSECGNVGHCLVDAIMVSLLWFEGDNFMMLSCGHDW